MYYATLHLQNPPDIMCFLFNHKGTEIWIVWLVMITDGSHFAKVSLLAYSLASLFLIIFFQIASLFGPSLELNAE